MTPDTIFDWINKIYAGGLGPLVLAVLWAGKMKVWVWGYQLEQALKDKDAQIAYERQEKDQWRMLALDTRDLTNRSLAVASRAVQQAQP